MPAIVDVVHGVDTVEERRQSLRQHALAQVPEVDHGDDGVPPARSGGGVLEGDHGLELALQRDVGELHGLAGQLRRRRAQQPDGRRQAGVPEALRRSRAVTRPAPVPRRPASPGPPAASRT